MTSERASTTFALQALFMVAGLLMFMPISNSSIFAQDPPLTAGPKSMFAPDHSAHHAEPAAHHDKSGGGMGSPAQWEGSPEGIAYSEFNHALSGVSVLLVGFSELHLALGLATMAWMRFLLPAGMFAFGMYLLIWSDHNAWPIGSFSFAQTFSGHDLEILQHKILAVLLLSVGSLELFRRLDYLQARKWSWVLPAFAIIGGLTLFLHMHGPHPQAHQIAMHHFVIGALALSAASSRFVGEYVGNRPSQEEYTRRVFMIIWSILILFIGIQLILYSESPS